MFDDKEIEDAIKRAKERNPDFDKKFTAGFKGRQRLRNIKYEKQAKLARDFDYHKTYDI